MLSTARLPSRFSPIVRPPIADDGIDDLADPLHFPHIVHAHNVSALRDGQCHRRGCTLHPLVRRQSPEQPPYRRLAGCADQQRHSKRPEPVQLPQYLNVLVGGLSEPDAGIDNDVFARNARRPRRVHAARQACEYVVEKAPIVVSPLVVHQHQPGIALRRHRRDLGVGLQAPHVVDGAGPGLKGGTGHGSLPCIYTDRDADLLRDRFQWRQQAVHLFLCRHRNVPRPRRFRADVEKVCPLFLEPQRLGNGCLNVARQPVAGE